MTQCREKILGAFEDIVGQALSTYHRLQASLPVPLPYATYIHTDTRGLPSQAMRLPQTNVFASKPMVTFGSTLSPLHPEGTG